MAPAERHGSEASGHSGIADKRGRHVPTRQPLPAGIVRDAALFTPNAPVIGSEAMPHHETHAGGTQWTSLRAAGQRK